MGDKVAPADLKPMPEDVYGKTAPQLKGANFLLDQNGALVDIMGKENLVVLIVGPA